MKRSLWFLMTLVAVVLMVMSCGGKKPQPAPQPPQPVSPDADALRIKIYTIQASEEPKPKWVNKRWYIGKDEEGVKTISPFQLRLFAKTTQHVLLRLRR